MSLRIAKGHRWLAAELGALQAGSVLKHLQSETAIDPDSLLPTNFDRAFKGEL